jgi:hypothetical protein
MFESALYECIAYWKMPLHARPIAADTRTSPAPFATGKNSQQPAEIQKYTEFKKVIPAA